MGYSPLSIPFELLRMQIDYWALASVLGGVLLIAIMIWIAVKLR